MIIKDFKEKNMNCNNENTLTRTNCRCENCTPIFDDSVNTNDCKLTPIFIDKLYNCTSQLYYEYNAPSVFVFGVAVFFHIEACFFIKIKGCAENCNSIGYGI